MAHCDTFCYNGFTNVLSRHTKVHPEERVFGCQHSALKLPGHQGVCGEKLDRTVLTKTTNSAHLFVLASSLEYLDGGFGARGQLVIPVDGTLKHNRSL